MKGSQEGFSKDEMVGRWLLWIRGAVACCVGGWSSILLNQESGNRIKRLVLFELMWVLSVSACIYPCSCIHMYEVHTCAVCVHLLGMHSQPGHCLHLRHRGGNLTFICCQIQPFLTTSIASESLNIL